MFRTVRRILVAMAVFGTGAVAMAEVSVTQLRCEYRTDPLAVGTGHPRLSWVLESDERGVKQSAYQVLVASDERTLAPGKADLWDSGRVVSDATNQVAHEGTPLASNQSVVWKVRVWVAGREDPTDWSPSGSWRMGIRNPADWKAKWIGAPAIVAADEPLPLRASPMLRKAFGIGKPIKRAVVLASALGLYELHINGKRVGDAYLTPEWTDYHKRVQYQAYDVTHLLREGENAIGAILADGWYAGRLGISNIAPDPTYREHYGRDLRLLAQLEIEFEDGTRATIVSDDSWRSTCHGPVRSACILDGEVYDARKELPGWSRPGYDDGDWQPVVVADAIDAKLVAQPNEPVRITDTIRPVSITEPMERVYVVDFGQEIAGVCRITADGPAGTTVTLRHAEMLQDDGMIYRENLRICPSVWNGEFGALQEDHFILSGKGEQTFQPRFVYHGFRYVEVTGLPGKLSADDIVALALHSAPPVAGAFECSSPLLNQLMHNIVWTQRDNMHSIPTDCPQRDERLGWSGDMLVFAQPACFNMDMAAFFTKWVRDIRDAQADDGRFADFSPNPYDSNKTFSGAPAWGDVGVFVPWRDYVNYNDKRLLGEHFAAMCKWVEWVHGNNPELLWKNQRGTFMDYGDWLNGDTLKLKGYPKGKGDIPKEAFATAYFHESAKIVAKAARVLGKTAEADKYGKLAEGIRQAFCAAYLHDDGTIANDTQSCYAIALAFDLVPVEQRAAMADRMVAAIHDYKDHISTGFHTTIMLMNELTKAGRSDVAYRLIDNTTSPSWGYSIKQGATTIWERWDGYVKGRGFQDPGMNSFCHYAIGSVGEWMYRSILGINPDEAHPGWRHFTIAPQMGGGLTWARGHYDSINGRIAVSWKLDGDALHLDVAVPANTTATVCVPGDASVLEGGKPVAEASGVSVDGSTDGATVLTVGSGEYHFVSTGVSASR